MTEQRKVGPTRRGGRLYANGAIEDDGDDGRVARSLIGRTIVDAVFYSSVSDGEWGNSGECLLWLDDGRVVEFGGWGHDAWGATLDERDRTEAEILRWEATR